MSRYHNYSVLGHLDLISRYDQQGVYPFEKVKLMVQEILRRVIDDGKGIEVNTSNRRYRLKDLPPAREILKLYREMGGRILTIGSDSHKREHLGACIEETRRELRQMGFETFCTYRGMVSQFHEL